MLWIHLTRAPPQYNPGVYEPSVMRESGFGYAEVAFLPLQAQFVTSGLLQEFPKQFGANYPRFTTTPMGETQHLLNDYLHSQNLAFM